MECQGRSLELGPGKDGTHRKLARGPTGAQLGLETMKL